jgi:hypothetical protein
VYICSENDISVFFNADLLILAALVSSNIPAN